MSIRNALLRLARRVLEQVLSVINQQINKLEQEIMQKMISLVTQGFDDVWRGEDADQFKTKVQQQAVRQCEGVIQITTGTHGGLIRASEVVTRADQQVQGMVNELSATFGRIY